MSKGLGSIQQKIITLLLGGLALSLSSTPKQYFKILGEIKKEIKGVPSGSLNRAIKGLYKSKLLKEKQNKDGTITLVLTNNGKQKALTCNLERIKIKKSQKWDKKWRIVLFDIPENRKKTRDALRFHLKKMDFFEYQKSVFAHPYNCKNEIDYIIEFYNIRRYVRFIVAESLDNELHLKRHFKLLV